MRMMAWRRLAQQAGPLRRCRAGLTWAARVALTVTPVALAPASDSEPTASANICELGGVGVETIEGSRLLQAHRERLELVRGRALECEHPSTQQVLAGVADALATWHVEGRVAPMPPLLSRPVRVHVDPRLPAGQAPVAGIEVHVTSREVLVTSAALRTLGAEVWRHELLHVLAARPPDVAPVARRLWLTLEEAVVQYLASSRAHDGGHATSVTRSTAAPDVHPGSLPPPPLPALALLASRAYDPHPLAGALARELAPVGSHPALDGWLSCLAAVPEAPEGSAQERREKGPGMNDDTRLGSEALAQVLRLFTSRCSPEVASALSAALGRGWGLPELGPRGEPRSEFSALDGPLR